MRLAWTLGLLALGLLIGLGWWLRPLQPDIMALQLAFSAPAFRSVLEHWGPQGLALYRAHFGADFVLLILYGAFGWRLATHAALFKVLSPRRRRWAAAMLPLAALADAAENALHLLLTTPVALAMPPQAGWIALAAVCASAKWLLLTAFALAVVGALGLSRRPARH
ncbi:MAG: hypothetical protein IAE92_10360 [Burkholderiaceae bacterium]|nr:hypothetical protein [Burkholderiaceae bacterium]